MRALFNKVKNLTIYGALLEDVDLENPRPNKQAVMEKKEAEPPQQPSLEESLGKWMGNPSKAMEIFPPEYLYLPNVIQQIIFLYDFDSNWYFFAKNDPKVLRYILNGKEN